MSLVSIPSYKTDDPNYRYKMPRLVAKVEGRGNGIRTNIVNMGDIARALKRPPDYPTKFCGHELGAQSKFDGAEGKAIVNGAHEQKDLQGLIDKFIDKFVLCQVCALPEVDLQIKKGRVGYRCNACGSQGDADNAHKLATFILRNPPDGAVSTMGSTKKAGGKKDKAAAKAATAEPEDQAQLIAAATAIADNEEEKKKKKKKSSKKKSKKDDGGDTNNNSESEEAQQVAEKTSKKKKKQQQQDQQQSTAVEGSGVEETEQLTYESQELQDTVQNMMAYATDEATHEMNVSPESFVEHLRLLSVSQSLTTQLKVFVALEVIFNPSLGKAVTPSSLEKQLPYVIATLHGCDTESVLIALEDFSALKLSCGFKIFPYLLQKLFSADALEEKTLVERYNNSTASPQAENVPSSLVSMMRKHHKKSKGGKNHSGSYEKAREAAAPFMEWLLAEGSSEDEEDEENDVVCQVGSSKAVDDDEEEVDIDAL